VFLAEHHAMKAYWGNGSIAPIILVLGTTRRSVVRFTLRPLYPRGKNSPLRRYPLERTLGGPQSRSQRGGEEKHLCPCRE